MERVGINVPNFNRTVSRTARQPGAVARKAYRLHRAVRTHGRRWRMKSKAMHACTPVGRGQKDLLRPGQKLAPPNRPSGFPLRFEEIRWVENPLLDDAVEASRNQLPTVAGYLGSRHGAR